MATKKAKMHEKAGMKKHMHKEKMEKMHESKGMKKAMKKGMRGC